MPKKEVKTNLVISITIIALVLMALYVLFNYKYRTSKSLPDKSMEYEALIGANQYYENRDFIVAIQKYKKGIEVDPKLYDAYIGLGNSYIELGLFDEAIKIFEKTFEIGYIDFRTYYGLGLANYVPENYKRAYDYLTTAYELNPKSRAVVSYLVNTYNALGLYDEAINIAKENLAGDSRDHHLYRKIAVSYLLKNDAVKALENINNALQINNSFHSNHLVLGEIHLHNGNAEDAIREIGSALELYKSSWTYEELSVAYYILGDYKSSDENANSAALYPSHSFSLSLFGFALLKNEKYEKAIEKFEAAINAKPDYYLPYKGLGKVYMELGQKEKAVNYWKKAAELNEFDKEVKELLNEASATHE